MKLKSALLLSLFIACQGGYAQTNRISSFDTLMQCLNAGQQVRVITYYALCKWAPENKSDTPVPDAISGMNIDTYEYFAPGTVHNKLAFVVFSNSKLIQNPKGKGYVYNYGKFRINADNTVQITAEYINPKNFKVQMNEVFAGKLNDGQNGEGVNLFRME